MTRFAWCSLLIGAVAIGCGGGGGKAAGTERGPCYGNGTCNAGLVCLSDLCVSPGGTCDSGSLDAGADAGSDAGTDAGIVPCDVLTQTGCGAGQACGLCGAGQACGLKAPPPDGGVSGADAGTYDGFCQAAGSQVTGQSCSATMPCVAGDLCGLGACLAYCDPNAGDPRCLPGMAGVGVAFPACDPLLQDCPAGWSCLFGQLVSGADPTTFCAPPFGSTTSIDGEACDGELQACNTPGLECVPEGSAGAPYYMCRPFCDTTSPSACSSAQVTTCTSYDTLFGMSFPGIPANLGLCTTGTSP